jgi:hypothetical protein
METETEITDKQGINKRLENIKPYQWKKGQSGNIMGRPKGKTMKEYVKEYLARMTDEERDEWLEGIDKTEIWKMSEGNPQSNTDITSAGKPIVTLSAEVIEKNAINTSAESNS